jgi:hypothetical protein
MPQKPRLDDGGIDDTEGHKKPPKLSETEDDTEGQARKVDETEEDDTEGHVKWGKRLDDADDVEGHIQRHA